MVLTQARYFLRLESGERVGETIPIPASGLKVGRRPDNDLQIQETSVSGSHAELLVDPAGVTLRDLGSTNGTRVGAEKIVEQRLAHGDDVTFGNVKASFVDGSLVDAPPAASSAAADTGEAVRTVGTDRIAKSGKRGMLGLLVLLVVLGGGGAAAFFFLGSGGEDGGGPAGLPVVEVAGNLLDDASFEGDAETWEVNDSAPTGFYRAGVYRNAGESGLGADLLGGEWAGVASPTVNVRARKALELTAAVDVALEAEARVGIELSASAGDRATFVAWGETLRETDGFHDVSFVVPSLPGYDQARLVVEARGTGVEGGDGGSVSVDDVALVEVDAPAPGATFEDDVFVACGEPAHTAALQHVSQVPISGMRLTTGEAGEGPRWTAGTLSATATKNGMRIAFDGAPSDARLVFTAHLEDPPFLATTGPSGFRAYGAGFEDVRATSLLFGGDARLRRLGFGREVTMSASSVGAGGLRVEIDLAGADGADLQLSFREERQEAMRLASQARDAARNDPARGLALWTQILDGYPFETGLVEEAERERSRILQEGHESLTALRDDFDRARFFGLPDLFRRCADQTRELSTRYAGSEVATAAAELAGEIDRERAALEGGRTDFERARLEAILGVVEREEWTGLAGRMRAAVGGDEER